MPARNETNMESLCFLYWIFQVFVVCNKSSSVCNCGMLILGDGFSHSQPNCIVSWVTYWWFVYSIADINGEYRSLELQNLLYINSGVFHLNRFTPPISFACTPQTFSPITQLSSSIFALFGLALLQNEHNFVKYFGEFHSPGGIWNISTYLWRAIYYVAPRARNIEKPKLLSSWYLFFHRLFDFRILLHCIYFVAILFHQFTSAFAEGNVCI